MTEPLHPSLANHNSAPLPSEESSISFLDLLVLLGRNAKLIIFGALAAGFAALGIAFLLPPIYTAKTTLLPPQQQSGANALLASLGPLAGLAGGAAAGLKSPIDQYVSLFQSNTVVDRLIDRYKLIDVYEAKLRTDARKTLAQHVRIAAGKKDGLITIEVDDKDPKRAADLANGHVEELRRLTTTLAVSEAQQRRVFFEGQLQEAKNKLTAAQIALQSSGFSQAALNVEPKTTAERYARLKAEVTSAEVRLASARKVLNEDALEIRQLEAARDQLRAQLARTEQEQAAGGPNGSDYVSKYREFKYQETLFELLARQYEAARVDESREGTLIQVVDPATPPERRSKPKRSLIAVATTLVTGLLLSLFVIMRALWKKERGEQPRASHI